MQVGANVIQPLPKSSTGTTTIETVNFDAISKSQAALSAS